MADEGNFFDKSFVLRGVEIIASTGKIIDIYATMMEMNIFEDIYSPTLSGDFLMNDSSDIVSVLPMQGFEFIRISFSKPGLKDIEKTFRIYKIEAGPKNDQNQANQTYMIRFCSEEAMISTGTIISKSYRGKTVYEIVKDIVEKSLGASGKIKGEALEKTSGMYDLIVPSMHPFDAINWVTGRTIPPFLFYENKNGYNLRNIQKLFEKDVVAKYGYAPKNTDLTGQDGVFKDKPDSEEIKVDSRNMISYQFSNFFDTMDGLRSGMFGSSLLTLDLVRLIQKNYVFEYKEEFDKTKHVDSKNKSFGSFDNDFKDRTKKTISEKPGAVRKFMPTNMEHNLDSIISGKQPNIKQDQIEQWLLQRISHMEQLNYFRAKFVAPGDVTLNVGDMIEFATPRLAVKDNTKESKEHPYYGGNYLLTAIRHKFNSKSYEMIMEGIKDCSSSKYPTADETDPNVDAVKSS